MSILTVQLACIDVNTPNVPRGTIDTIYVSDTIIKPVRLNTRYNLPDGYKGNRFVDIKIDSGNYINKGMVVIFDTFDFVQMFDTTDNYTFNDSTILIKKGNFIYFFHKDKGIFLKHEI